MVTGWVKLQSSPSTARLVDGYGRRNGSHIESKGFNLKN